MMAETDLRYKALHLQTVGGEAMPIVLQMLRDSGLSDLCYAYKIRTKPESKLVEKVNRKREKRPEYSLANITDVVGARLVALFRSEMADIFEGVLSVIAHRNGINPNPFQKGAPEEIIIYKGTNAFDELPPRLKEIAHNFFPKISIKEEHSREGYSSVHLVTRLNFCPKELPCANYKLPIEIQIRSVFEDAWGEIDHKYGYVSRSGKGVGKPINNPEFVLSHLKVLKRFSDACMEYADAIKTEAVGIPPVLIATKKVVSVMSDDFILERFKSLQISNGAIEKYCEARDIKDQAAAFMDSNLNQGKQLYLTAAELFRELFSLIDSGELPGEKLFYYYLKMNEALCLMSTNERDQVVASYGIYQSLENLYPDYPLLKMRYGQVLGKLGYLDQAIEFLRNTGILAQEIATKHDKAVPSGWPDNLPYTDYEHIAQTQPKLLGYHLWLKIRTIEAQEENLKGPLFMEAYEITATGLTAVAPESKQELSLHNNLLYYALGVMTRADSITFSGSMDINTMKECAIEHLNYIETHKPNINEIPISTVDTIMKAYSILGRSQDAINAANVLVDRCLDSSNMDFNENEKLMAIRSARKIINGEPIDKID